MADLSLFLSRSFPVHTTTLLWCEQVHGKGPWHCGRDHCSVAGGLQASRVSPFFSPATLKFLRQNHEEGFGKIRIS